MATLVIKNLPDDLHRRLKEEAQKAHRSMNGEAVYLLEAGLNHSPALSAARELPAPYEGKKPLTDKLIHQWKRKGMA
jgi:plasmid stability protein